MHSIHVPSQHISGLSVDAKCLVGTLGKSNSHFDWIRLLCSCTVWHCWLCNIPCTIARFVKKDNPHGENVLNFERKVKIFCFPFSGDLLENYCWDDDLMNFSRVLFSISILLTFPIECFVSREVCFMQD